MKNLGTRESGARFSDDMFYRFVLWRRWDESLPVFAACMLNPSTADHEQLDPTVKQVRKRAAALGFGSLLVVNIFAYRSTDPDALAKISDPIGNYADFDTSNDRTIIEVATDAQVLLLGWGAHGKLLDRGMRVMHLLRDFMHKCRYLKMTKNKQPGHPLYIADNEPLKEFSNGHKT